MWLAKLSAMAAARCAAARCSPEASVTSASQASARRLATSIEGSLQASSTVGAWVKGTDPALGLKLRMGQTTAPGVRTASRGVAPERWTMTQLGDTMAEMPSDTSAIKPSVTATTTTWASANAPAASDSDVVHGHPSCSPKGRADRSVRLTTCKTSWPSRCHAGPSSQETRPAPMSTMR